MSDNSKNDKKNMAVDLGPQPLDNLLRELDLKPKLLIDSSESQLSFKVIQKGRKGRKLTPNSKNKILLALNKATQKEYKLKDLFNY